MSPLPKLMVIGYARSGKDTACEILRDLFGFRFISSSVFCIEKAVRPSLLQAGYAYQSDEECMARREEVPDWRRLWFEAIKDYNTPDPTRLGRELYSRYDIYCGIRRLEEFEALKDAGVFDFSVWIDASKRLPPESLISNTLTPDVADYVVNNSGSVEALKTRLYYLMRGLLD